jgi:small subunit ribosomal protein S2
MVEKLAIEVGEYSHCHDFRGGTFSNPLITFGAATRLPDLVIFFNTNNNVLDTHRAVKDAARLAIPTIGIVDTSCDPRLVTYPVPGNDDTPTSIEFYCKVFKNAVLAGKSRVS